MRLNPRPVLEAKAHRCALALVVHLEQPTRAVAELTPTTEMVGTDLVAVVVTSEAVAAVLVATSVLVAVAQVTLIPL